MQLNKKQEDAIAIAVQVMECCGDSSDEINSAIDTLLDLKNKSIHNRVKRNLARKADVQFRKYFNNTSL